MAHRVASGETLVVEMRINECYADELIPLLCGSWNAFRW
jgi:hypothetical protein